MVVSRKINPVKSLKEYIARLNNILENENSPSQYIFRGQSNAAWPLWSGVVRRLTEAKKKNNHDSFVVSKSEIRFYLTEKISETRKREDSHPIIKGMSDIRLMTEMQHYGAATILLDFSFNALVSLYMAASENSKVDGKVFCINYKKKTDFKEIVDYQETEDDGNIKKVPQILFDSDGKIMVYRPYHSNTRIIKQESIFIFHDTGIIEQDQIDHEIVIDKNAKEDIINDLGAMIGLNDETIYPDFLGYLQANNSAKPFKILSPTDYYKLAFDYNLRASGDGPKEKENQDKAIEYYKKAIELDGDFYDAIINLAVIYNDIGKYDDAIILLDQAVKNKLCDEDAWYNRGISYHCKENYTKAIADYKRALRYYPEDTGALNNIGDSYNKIEKYDLSLQFYQKALKINKTDGDLWFGIGEVYYNKKNYKKAITYFLKAINCDNGDKDCYSMIGHCYFELGEFAEAKRWYLERLGIDRKDPETFSQLGVIFFKEENFSNALLYFNESVLLQETYGDGWNNLGVLHMRTKALNEAEEKIKIAIVHNCKNHGYKSLGHLYLCRENENKAIEYYKLSLKEYRNFKEFWNDFLLDYHELNLLQYDITEYQYRKLRTKILS